MKKLSNLEKWMASLTPEQLVEHKAKMALGRKRYRESKKANSVAAEAPPTTNGRVGAPPHPTPSTTPLTHAQATAPEYAPVFRKLLGEYVDILACMTGGGTYTTDYCRLCVQTGIHGGNGGCGCPCHRARAALAGFDER